LRNRTIDIWNWKSGSAGLDKAQQVTADSDQFAVSWSPDGTRLATLADDRTSTIQIWDTGTWALVDEFALPYANPRRALNWSADGQRINDAGESGGQVIYFSMSVDDGSVDELGTLPIASASALAFSPDLQSLAVADAGGNVQILAVESGNTLAEFKSVQSPIDLAWNPKNSTLAVLGYDASLQLWSLAV
jgi:WD40 repeat protein